MNSRTLFFAGIYLFCFLFSLPLLAQTQLTTDKKEAIYQVGATANFQATSSIAGTYNYKIYYDDRTKAIESGSITLSANQSRTIPYRASKAGVVLCSIAGPGGSDVTAATFSPFAIAPLENEPSDFDQYWNTQKSLVQGLGTTPQLVVHKNNANSTTYTISLPNINGRRVYGYMTVPKGSGPFPATIIFPAFGATAAATSEEILVAESGGLITVSLSVHNTPVTQQDPNAYTPDNTGNRDEVYYRYAMTGAINVINYLQTRPDFDRQNICTMGVSQGGGLAMLLAGIDNRVNLLVNSNPAMNEHQGHKYDQASGFPYYLSDALLTTNGQSAYDATSRATKYYDAVYANRRFKGSSYTLIGLKDDIVPAATSFAGYNQLRGEKILLLSVDGGHGHPGEYWNGRYDFLRRHYQLTPPNQFAATTKGYTIQAGSPQSTSTSTGINLNASVQLENQTLSNLSSQWRKVSGPGTVNFGSANSTSTSASFSQAGTYILQFQAQDNRKLAGEGKIYFLSDDIEITVTAGNTGGGTTGGTTTGGGTTGGTTTGGGTTGGTTTGGNTSNLTINCPSNITLTAPAGQSSMPASWTLPSVSSTCGQSNTGDCSTTITGFSYLGQVGQSNYFLSNELMMWKSAEADAKRFGGTMASIDNQSVNDLIQQIGEIVYIGLTDEATEGAFKWLNGKPLQFTNFQADVSNTQGLDYVALNPWDGSWAYYDNVAAKKYILEVPCNSTNNTGSPTLSQINGLNSGSNFSIGTTTISYRATDPCGNTKTCSFTVTVNETPATIDINCPANQTVQIKEGETNLLADWQAPTASTNCPNGTTITQLSGPTNNSTLRDGNYTISYEAINACNNRSTCSFSVTVLEAPTPPTNIGSLNLSCPENRTVNIGITEQSARVSWTAPQANSTCPTSGNCTERTLEGFSYIGQFNGSSYYVSTVKSNWEIALSTTSNMAGHLVQIDSEAENNFLKENLDPNYYLTGLSDENNEGSFVWTDGSSSTYTNYEPNLGNSIFNNYIVLNTWEGTWTLRGGSIYLNYILEVPCNGTTPITTQIGGPNNGSLLTIGTNVIEYEATDNCGNTASCNFTITVNQSQTGTLDCIGGDGGNLGVSEQFCEPFQATTISELFAPLGLNEGYEYIWLSSNTSCPTSIDQQIEGADKEFHEPRFISETTYFVRWKRLIGCTEWKKSTCVVKEIKNCQDNTTDNGPSGPGVGNGGNGPTGDDNTSCLIQPQAISQNWGTAIGGDIQSLIDGKGLSAESATAIHETGSLYEGIWLNDGTDPILILDLGSVQAIDGIVIWNYAYHHWHVLKRRGIKDFSIATSMNGASYSQEERFTARITTESGMPEQAQFFALSSSRNARYVQLSVLNAQDDASYVGLGEIRFTNNCGQGVTTISTEVNSKIDASLNSTTNKEGLNEWSISPNPSTGLFYISAPITGEGEYALTVFNEIGKRVRHEIGLTENHRLDLQNLPKGLYFVKIQSPTSNYKLEKIIIH